MGDFMGAAFFHLLLGLLLAALLDVLVGCWGKRLTVSEMKRLPNKSECSESAVASLLHGGRR